MKIILSLLIVFLFVSQANADDDYSDMVYTATSFLYWCKYKEVPASLEDFAKVTDINDPNEKLTLDPEVWFGTVVFRVEGDNLKVIRATEAIQNGKTVTTTTSTSVSDCESHKIITKQPNKAN